MPAGLAYGTGPADESGMTKTFLALTLVVALLAPAAAQAHDGDRDGLPDRWEKRHGTKAKKKSAAKDPDSDSLSNLGEFQSKTSPKRVDSDRDGVRDDDEDRDRDGVDNSNEDREGTNSRKRDTDGDGLSDAGEDRDRDGLSNGGEDFTGNDPLDRDTDDDDTSDGAEQAGVVSSFDGTVLTIDLATGQRLTGTIDDLTEVDCDSERAQEAGHSSSRRSGGPSRRATAAVDEDLGDEDDPGDEDGDAGDEEDFDDPFFGEDDEFEDEEESDGDLLGSDGKPCSAADLRPGVRIHEGEATATESGLTFDVVELLR